MRSDDGGQTWTVLNEANGLEGIIVPSLFMHPEDPDILLAAATNPFGGPHLETLGVYVTRDGGDTWERILMKDLALSEDGTVLYVGTSGRGVYRLGALSESPSVLSPVEGPAPAATATPPPAPSKAEGPTPTQVATAPASTPPLAQPTAPSEVIPTPTPELSGGRGICGGVAAVPLALAGLVWSRRRS